MKKRLFQFLSLSVLILGMVSCTKDLDLFPVNDVTSEVVYSTPEGYKQSLAKVYGAFALTGNTGPTGAGDIRGIDEGTSDFLRLYWKAQELTTDEAVVRWTDPGLLDFHNMNWSSNNPMLIGLYNRIFYQITLANAFIDEAADDKMGSRGISGTAAEDVRKYRAEARFLRAYQYWVAMDLFGNVPFTTSVGSDFPQQTTRSALFTFIESELKAIEGDLVNARQNEYGRADKGAAWALLARMYLNAKTYTGQDRYTDAIVYAKKVIDAGYTLIPNYRHLFLADNNKQTNELIFTINYDGIKTKNWGGTTVIVHGALGGGMKAPDYGVDGVWEGFRTTKNLVQLFADPSGATDKRAIFYSEQQSLEIDDIRDFKQGYAVPKFQNITSTGGKASDPTHVDVDFPLFRLAEMYLVYAEAVLRGGQGGDRATALQYINLLRQRAYGNNNGNITDAQLTTNFILDERGRELYWEAHRRTDLIRYDRFTEGTYLWPWKGGVKTGRAVEDFRKLFPLPVTDVVANPNLKQNTGY